jgi:signal transduction histidine kinase
MKLTSSKLLIFSGLFGLTAIWVSSMASLETPAQRVWVSLILLAIAILFYIQQFPVNIPHARWVRNILMTGLAACLFFFKSGWNFFPIVFFIFGPQVMIDFPLKVGVMWLVAYTLITGFFMVSASGLAGLIDLLPYTAGYVFFGFFGWTLVQAQKDRQRSEELLADLQTAHEKLQRYTEQVEELTITEERSRIAREMHDTLGHRLTIAAVQLEGAARLIHTNPQKTETIIRTVHEQVKEGLAELRKTVAMMRAPVDEDMPLPQALTRLVSGVKEATGLNVQLELDNRLPGLPSPHRHALFRAAQEGLTNIERHASASEAWIRLFRDGDNVRLMIEDNGIGLDASIESAGLGLTGMRERAALLNGGFVIQPREAGGTRLVFSLPVPEGTAL